jgi:mono/diheme cytochrome c family protein
MRPSSIFSVFSSSRRRPARMRVALFLLLCASVLLGACAQNMRDDGRLKPYEPLPGFGNSQLQIPVESVARSQPADISVETGRVDGDGDFLTTFPIAVSAETLQRGQLRYNIYCAPCHGAMGDLQGLIIPNFGFEKKPTSYHEAEVKELSAGELYDIASNGTGIMFGYSNRVPVSDRWAIVAYIRAMQLNPEAPLEVSPEAVEQAAGGIQ